MVHICPRCGDQTEGAFSEGGIRWAICEDCVAEERREAAFEHERRTGGAGTYESDEL